MGVSTHWLSSRTRQGCLGSLQLGRIGILAIDESMASRGVCHVYYGESVSQCGCLLRTSIVFFWLFFLIFFLLFLFAFFWYPIAQILRYPTLTPSITPPLHPTSPCPSLILPLQLTPSPFPPHPYPPPLPPLPSGMCVGGS